MTWRISDKGKAGFVPNERQSHRILFPEEKARQDAGRDRENQPHLEEVAFGNALSMGIGPFPIVSGHIEGQSSFRLEIASFSAREFSIGVNCCNLVSKRPD